MYSDWSSLVDEIKDEDSRSLDDALKAFPPVVGKGVVKLVLKALNDTSSLSSSQKDTVSEPTVSLTTHRQVEWTMGVISYGLSLPLSEQDLMHLCIDTYDVWMSVIYDPKPSVPAPVREQPDLYVQMIFRQLCQVFDERPETIPSSTSSGTNSAIQVMLENQALLCSRILRMLHMTVIQSAARLSRESWDCLLMSLLRVTNVVLAPPLESNSLATNLKSLPVHVLFVSWLQASVHAFPRPQLWKSLYELCHHWRHHACLANQWTKLVYTLTFRVIGNLYTENYLNEIKRSSIRLDNTFEKIIDVMPYDVSIQCWYRILHTLGDPVELAYPMSVATLPAFKKFAQEREGALRYRSQQPPTQASLAILPRIYYELMRGVATLVYLFQGKDVTWVEWEDTEKKSGSFLRSSTREKGGRQKQAAGGGANTSWYVPKTPSTSSSHTGRRDHHHSSTTTDYENVFGEIRKPKGNTLLQLFGKWLFKAAIWPIEEVQSKGNSLFSSLTDLSAPKTMREPEDMLRYEKGRAEAFGALCSIFSSQDCGDPFQPIYLAKFYHALILGLHYTPETSQGHVLTEILLHSRGLLRKDLMGINLVVPYFIDALELILPQHKPPFKWVVDLTELRHASIDLLLSMICLPLHFLSQPLPNVFAILPDLWKMVPTTRSSFSSDKSEDPQITEQQEREPLTFLSLRDPLVQLLLNAIMHEGSPLNKQLLLHALNAIICDIVTYEDLLSKLVSDESPDDHDGLSAQEQPGGPRGSFTRSEMSHHFSEFSPSQLVDKAILVCKSCLTPLEGDGSDTPVQVCLAALELLASIARLPPDTCNHSDIRLAVHMVSEFIEFQAMKDQPRHNRDLHTSIVAAFKALMTFTLAHPYLLGSKESMACVMRVIELGISGRFSVDQDGKVTYKGDKTDRPISGRVKEIAEFMLYLVMENVYAFPSPCGAEAGSSLLSEEDIIARLPPEKREQAKFQYFLLDNSVLVGLLEEPFTNTDSGSGGDGSTSSSLPTVTAVVRSPSGRHVWSMQLRHHPRSHQPSSDHLHSARRPSPKPHPCVPAASVERKPWPDEVNQFPSLKLDFSLPTLDEVLDSSSQGLHDEIYHLTKNQVEQELKLSRAFYHELENASFPDPRTAVEPPLIQEKFSTARLFLNHLSLLGMEGIKEVSISRCQPLVRMDSSHPKFSKSLSTLDNLPSRFCNTIFVLYAKEGVVKSEEILALNSSLINKPGEFLEFLSSLGWLVDPSTHPGFAGKIHSPKLEGPSVSSAARPVGICAQIHPRPFPYYTDSVNELAFVVPKLRQTAGDSSASLRSAESSDSGQDLALVQNVSTLVASQQSRLLPASPMPHPPATPPGSRSSGQDSPSSLKPPIATPTVSTAPATPTSATNAMYMNIDMLAPKATPPVGGTASESTSTVSATAEGYATYPGLGHQHNMGKSRSSKGEVYSGVGGAGGETPRRKWHQQDCAAMIVWLEKFEDHLTFPVTVLSKLLHSVSYSGAGSHKPPHTAKRQLPVVFIHKMTSGLYQIVTKNTGGRPDSIAGPLIDGMVVSRRSLGILARQTVINVCSRLRMENEGFFPPHVKRKRKLEEMGHSYKQSLSVADFYTKLFTGKS